MPIYLFWGEDHFSVSLAVKKLQESVLDPDWADLNFDKFTTESPEDVIEAFSRVTQEPMVMGDRLVWLNNSNICQRCPDKVLSELKEVLPVIPSTNHLLITTSNKPDGRLKSTKLLFEYAEVKEFSLIPPWKTDDLIKKVNELAALIGLSFTHKGAEFLVNCLGNDTQLIYNEILKLSLYYNQPSKALDQTAIAPLVNPSNQNSLQLANAIKDGNVSKALELATELINHNEPALKIVATLIGQFRTWTIVKLMIEQGETDEKTIATKAEINNPKRIYILRKELQSVPSKKLLLILPLLLELEYSLKKGAEALPCLQTKIVEMNALELK